MKSRGGKFLLLIGAVLAAMAFIVVYVVMSGKLNLGSPAVDETASVPTAVPMVSVAVVNRDIPAYTMLDSTNVATIDMEASTVPSGTTTAPAAVFGKLTLVPLAKGQPVRQDQLTETGFSNILAKGERAYVLPVPAKNAFGDAITENDYVDLLWTASIKKVVSATPAAGGDNSQQGGDTKAGCGCSDFMTTKTLLQNLHVLRVITLQDAVPAGTQQNSQAAATDASSGAVQPAAPGKATSASMYVSEAPFHTVLVLGVTDQQAELITFAQINGQIDLTLRSSAAQKNEVGEVVKDEQGRDIRGDKDLETTTGITLQVIIEQYGLIAPPTEWPSIAP
jgi:Flp pilus assembly protein CpaB